MTGWDATPPETAVDMLQRIQREATERLLRSRDDVILESIGLQLRQGVRVRIKRPGWMPERLYRLLMRSIVIEETLVSVTLTR